MMNPLIDGRLSEGTFEYHDRIDSTNLRAKTLAAEGAKHMFLVIADEQTQGRGRRGRSWLSESGRGAWMSLILRPENLPMERAPEIVFVCAVAVAKAIGGEAKIKWPNDIVLRGKKICGMMCEASNKDGCAEWIVCGIGVNLLGTQFPEDLPYAGSVESVTGEKVCRAAFVEKFLAEFKKMYALWEKEGLAGVMRLYRPLSVTLGSAVRAILTDGTLDGIATGIAEDGALLVTDDEGVEHVLHAGDVSVRGMMGYV